MCDCCEHRPHTADLGPACCLPHVASPHVHRGLACGLFKVHLLCTDLNVFIWARLFCCAPTSSCPAVRRPPHVLLGPACGLRCVPTSCCSSGGGLRTSSCPPAVRRPHHVHLGPACGLLQVQLLCADPIMFNCIWPVVSFMSHLLCLSLIVLKEL